MTITAEQQSQWQEQGYLHLPAFYSAQVIAEINELVDRLWTDRKTLGNKYVIDVFCETSKERRLHFADAPNAAREHPYKLNDLFLTQEQIREVVIGNRISPILVELLGGSPMVCNSLNFEFGSQQELHFDTFYMPSPTPNKMVASWIALEDATPDNGPLSYYPGSHKIPAYMFSSGSTLVVNRELPACQAYVFDEIEKRGLQPETLHAKTGDVLIWHSQLFHGGSPIKDKSKTRKSLVTHYFTTEDFPNLKPVAVGDLGSYMDRDAQPVPEQVLADNWWEQN